MTMDPKLSTRALSKSFRKGSVAVEVLRDLDIDIFPGEFVSIVGASGCGKTTFLRLVDGLIEPSQGSVTIDGQIVDKPGDRIAFVFQQDGLFPWRTVTDNAALGPEIQGRDAGGARRSPIAICASSGSPASTATIRTSFPAACASA